MSHPTSPGEHQVVVHGVPLRYRVAGSGPPLVVQPPGWGIGAALYEAGFAPLEKDFTVVHHDPRGSGASGAPADAGDLHVGAFVDDLEGLRAHLGLERVALMGHSHGGLIALHYALRHPERVQRLVLVDAQLVGVPPHPDEEQFSPGPDTNPEVEAAYESIEAAGGIMGLMGVTDAKELGAALARMAPLYFLHAKNVEPLRRFFAEGRVPPVTMQAVSSQDGGFPLPMAELRALRVPTLVATGRFDVFCSPGAARTLADAVPGARFEAFEESGHLPWLEEPKRFFEVVRAFLAGR